MSTPSDKPKLLITRRLPANVEARAARDYTITPNPGDQLLDSAALLSAAEGHDAILCCSTERFAPEVFAALTKQVRIIATFSVGYEHIDVKAAQAHNVTVTNTPDVLNDATADVAMLCLLGAARRGAEADAYLRAGKWVGWTSTMMLGTHVTGKRLGIYGMGRIGQAVARRARGFDMTIHYYNRAKLSADLEQGAVYHDTPESLLAVSDFLSINAPSTPETRHFFNAERLALMPPGAVLVNTARGDLIKDEALIAALKSGHIAAAGLDVYEGEPNLNPEYGKLDNTFLLPHLGSATLDTRDQMGFCCLDNLDAFFKGQACPNPI